jgi:CelD/BcsL family acetyltransferase involved in cellulose biosynthesis
MLSSSGETALPTVSLVTDRGEFVRMEGEWNALVESTRDEPFYRHEYIRSWIESFSPDAGLRLLAGHDQRGRLVAVLPLIEQRNSVLGVPVLEWASPTNVHSYRFDLLAEDPDAAAVAFLDRLVAESAWDVLRITDVPHGGNAWQLYRRARWAGLPAGVYPSQRSPYIPLPASFDDLARSLRSKFRSNLRRRRRLLERLGPVSVERIADGPDLQPQLERCFAIEQGGWKGRSGQPANGDARIHGFYCELARRMSDRGSLSLFLLKVGGRPVAFHYGLTERHVYSLVMTSYDESLRECSPGHLLVEEVLKRCIESGVREFDFLGCDHAWKRAWTERVRIHCWLFLFRNNPLGRTLCRAKFDWAPAAKRLLGSWGQARLSSRPAHESRI